MYKEKEMIKAMKIFRNNKIWCVSDGERVDYQGTTIRNIKFKDILFRKSIIW